jgi:hypothetical protein
MFFPNFAQNVFSLLEPALRYLIDGERGQHVGGVNQ